MKDQLSYSTLFAEQIPAIGHRNQHQLRKLSVAIVGVGGVGGVVAQVLALSGVGRLTLLDPQTVEAGNFNRSIAMTGAEIGTPKAEMLAVSLRRRPHLQVRAVVARMESKAAHLALTHVDVLCCCANTRSSRLAAARYAIEQGLPYVSAGVSDARVELAGQVLVRRPSQLDVACEGCFDGVTTSARRRPAPGVVLPTVAAVVAGIASHAIIAPALPVKPKISPNLYVIDLAQLTMEAMVVRKRPDCGICGG